MNVSKRKRTPRKVFIKLRDKQVLREEGMVRQVILEQKFYEDLSQKKTKNNVDEQKRKRKIMNVNSDATPPTDTSEITNTLQQLNNRKSRGDDGIQAEIMIL